MRRADLSDLQAFRAVATERSFTRAAAQLGVSPSALSQTLRALEVRLGLRLLTRTTRSVAPTEAGERLLGTLGPAFDEIEAALDALGGLREKPSGTIRITAAEHARGHGALAGARAPAAGLPGHHGRGACGQHPHRPRRRALRRRHPHRRAGGQGHGRGAHRPGAPHGRRRRARLLRSAAAAGDAAGPDEARLYQHPACRRWAGSTPGSSRRTGASSASTSTGRWCSMSRSRCCGGHWPASASPACSRTRCRRISPMGGCCACWPTGARPFPGYHLYYPSRRQPTPAFELLVDALRQRR
jgi:hypothetical protein